jgi:hypothetical protein
MIRRTVPATVLALLLLGAAYVVLGRPDPGRAVRFFSGGIPTIEEGEAVVSLISWVVVAGVAVVSVGGSLRALTRSDMLRQRSRRAVLAFAAGLLLLVVATVQRSLPAPVSVCCGDLVTAAQEAQSLGR